MTLYSWIQDYITRYSFIKRTEFKLMYVYFYYDKNGKEKHKKLPYRANKKHVQRMILKIKKDINYQADRKIRDEKVKEEMKKDDKKKPFLFGITTNTKSGNS